MRILESHPGSEVHWVVFSSIEIRKAEALVSAKQFLSDAEKSIISVREFRDGFFPYHGLEIKEQFESLKALMDPDLIFTHYHADAHQDHRLINELTWNTFRNHFVLEYEIPKYEGDLGQPNMYTLLDERTCQKKIEILIKKSDGSFELKDFDEGGLDSVAIKKGRTKRSKKDESESLF